MRRPLLMALVLLCSLSAQAQPAIDGTLLGIDEPALKSLFPDIQRVAKPVRGPHRARGLWRLEHTPLADLSLDTTFYISRRQVVRIEQQVLLDQPDCPAPAPDTALFAELQARYGSSLASNNNDGSGHVQRSLAWVAEGTNVTLYLTQESAQCDVLLVYQPHIEKDGSEL